MKILNLLRNLSLSLAFSPLALGAANLGVSQQLPIHILTPGEACKIDDASAVKLLYLNCIARRDDRRSDLNCLDPSDVIGPLYLTTSNQQPIPLPKPVHASRLKAHHLFEQSIHTNPNPIAVFQNLQTGLKRLADCKVSVEFWGKRIGTDVAKIRYETDLADALGLSFNERTVRLAADLDNQEILPQQSVWVYGFLSQKSNLRSLIKEGERYSPPAPFWLSHYGAGHAFSGGISPMDALFTIPSDSLYKAYGAPHMTQEENGCYHRSDGHAVVFSFWGRALWRQAISSLVPAEEKAGIAISDLLLNANALNPVMHTGSSWSSDATVLKKGKKCPGARK